MPKREGGGLGVVITGSPAQVKLAEQVIKDIIERGYSEITHPGISGNQIVLEDSQMVGRIAGKDAKFVKAIQNKSGATIQLPDTNATEKVISIFGKPHEVQRAKEYINCLISLGYSEATHPGWVSEAVGFKPENLGRLIGLEGKTIKELSKKCDVRIETPKRDDPTAQQDVILIKGIQSNIDRAKEAIDELLAAVNEQPDELPVPDPDDPWQQEPQEPEW